MRGWILMRTININNENKDKDKQEIKNTFSREFTSKYDEVDRLTEQAYSNLT
jgi:hypothetical protein